MGKKSVKRAKESALRTIRSAMEACEKKGIKIVAEDWGVKIDEDKRSFVPDVNWAREKASVCALGALLVHKNGSVKFDAFRGSRPLSEVEADETAAYVLGVDKSWVDLFVSGFDNSHPEDMSTNYQELLGYDEVKRADGSYEYAFVKTSDPQVREHRRAYRMGKRLRDEFV